MTALTLVFFFVASHVLPYVPTVLASTLVLFLGIELTFEAVWQSAKTLTFTEWLIVFATLIACTFLGFAEGFGVGIGAATVLYLLLGAVDTVSPSRENFDQRSNSTSRKPPLLSSTKRPTAPDIRRWHTVRGSVSVRTRHRGLAFIASISKTRLHLRNLRMLPCQDITSNHDIQKTSAIGISPRSRYSFLRDTFVSTVDGIDHVQL